MEYVQFFQQNLAALFPKEGIVGNLLWELDREVISQEKIRLLAEQYYEESLDRLLILTVALHTTLPLEDPFLQKLRIAWRKRQERGSTYEAMARCLGLVLLGEKKEISFPTNLFFAEQDPLREDVRVPRPSEYLPAALFAWIIFLETGNEEAKEAALQVAAWQQELLTDEGNLLIGPWVREETFSRAHFYIWTYLLLREEKLFHKIAELPFELLERVDPITYFIAEYLENKPSFPLPLPKKSLEYLEVSLMRGNGGAWAFSLLGDGTGFGSFAKEEVQITSFGPHFFPLGEICHYGIERGYVEGGRSDWTQAVYVPEEGKLWLRFTVIEEAQGWRLRVWTEHLQLKTPFAFVFFVTAGSAQIGHQVKLHSSSLDRYVGRKEVIQFFSNGHSLSIEPQFATEQEVIPLAGMDHFWGADFLVAHTIPPYNRIYEWIIK